MQKWIVTCVLVFILANAASAQVRVVSDIHIVAGDKLLAYTWSIRGYNPDCIVFGAAVGSADSVFGIEEDPRTRGTAGYFSYSVYCLPRHGGLFIDTVYVYWQWQRSRCGTPYPNSDTVVLRCHAIEDSGFYFKPNASTDTLHNDDARQASSGSVELQYVNRSSDEVQILSVRAIGTDSAWTRTEIDPSRYGAGPVPIGGQSTGSLAVLFATKNAPREDWNHDTLEVLSGRGDKLKLDTVDVSYITAPDDRVTEIAPALTRFGNQPRSTSSAKVLIHNLDRASNFRVDSADWGMEGLSAAYSRSSDSTGTVAITCRPTSFDWNGVWRYLSLRYDRYLYNGRLGDQRTVSLPVNWSFSIDSLQPSGNLRAVIIRKADTVVQNRDRNLATFRLSSNCTIDRSLVLYNQYQGRLYVDSSSPLEFETQLFDEPLGEYVDTVTIYAGFTDTACGYGDVLRLPIRYFVAPEVESVEQSTKRDARPLIMIGDKLHAMLDDGVWQLAVYDVVGRTVLRTPVTLRIGEASCERLKTLPRGIYWMSLANGVSRLTGKVVLP